MEWSPTNPEPGEAFVVDEAAEETARIVLAADARQFGYALRNARVSQLGDAKIVRLDLWDPELGKTVGAAMWVEQPDHIHEAMHLF